MKHRIRILVVSFVIVILAAAAVLVLLPKSGSTADPTAVATVVVTQGRIEETIGASGNVAASQQTNLSFNASGTVAQVPAVAGQQVKEGQVLAQLDTSDLELQVQNAQASLDAALLNLQQAQQPPTAADLASAQAALDSALANYESVKAGPTASDLASARAAVVSAQANYNSVKAGPTADSLAAAKAAVEQAQAALAQAQAAYDQVKSQPSVAMSSQALTLQNDTIALQEAQANYNSAADHPTQAELTAAKATLASAQYQLDQLLQTPTQADLTAAQAQVASAQYTLSQLQSQPSAQTVQVAQTQVTQAQVALAQAQASLAGATITAPYDGTVLAVQINQGDLAGSGTVAVVMTPVGPPVVDANIDEVDVATMAVGQAAHLTFEALPGVTVTGTVASIAPESTSVNGAVAYPVVIGFEPGRLPVRLGMTTIVAVVVASADHALLVPSAAITADRQTNTYFVTRLLPDGTEQNVQVRIGLHNDTQTQILQGVSAGDHLVIPQITGSTTSSSSSSSSSFRGLGGLTGGRPAGGGGGGGGGGGN
jgi:HlyD family secretion protein